MRLGKAIVRVLCSTHAIPKPARFSGLYIPPSRNISIHIRYQLARLCSDRDGVRFTTFIGVPSHVRENLLASVLLGDFIDSISIN
jgi:hypothetical protein